MQPAAPQALKDWPCCNRATISDEKVENVVRPPQKPVMTNNRHSGASPEKEVRRMQRPPQ